MALSEEQKQGRAGGLPNKAASGEGGVLCVDGGGTPWNRLPGDLEVLL